MGYSQNYTGVSVFLISFPYSLEKESHVPISPSEIFVRRAFLIRKKGPILENF